MQIPNASDDTSWWDDLIAGLSQKQVLPPPAPQPPPVNQVGWEKSVEQAKISDSLGSVHDLGLIIFNETQSYSDRPDSNEPLDVAREKLGHAVMNADQKWGAARMHNASTALPIEPSQKALGNPAVRTAYNSSMRAAREAYLVRFFRSRNRPQTARITHLQTVSEREFRSARSPGPITTHFRTKKTCHRALRG